MAKEKKAAKKKTAKKAPAKKAPAKAKAVAKKQRKKAVYKCASCSKSFSGGRALGTHYDDASNPCQRPEGKKAAKKKPAKKKAAGKKAAGKKAASGFAAQLKTLAATLDAEIKQHEKAIKALQSKKKKLAKLM